MTFGKEIWLKNGKFAAVQEEYLLNRLPLNPLTLTNTNGKKSY